MISITISRSLIHFSYDIIFHFVTLRYIHYTTQSMLSKVVPLALAKGTWNSGFIATSITTVRDYLIYCTVMIHPFFQHQLLCFISF